MSTTPPVPALSPDEAITKLRALPEDQQRLVLGQLDEETRKGILGKLGAPDAAAEDTSLLGKFKSGYHDLTTHVPNDSFSGVVHNFAGAAAKTLKRTVYDPLQPGFKRGFDLSPEAYQGVDWKAAAKHPLDTAVDEAGGLAGGMALGEVADSAVRGVGASVRAVPKVLRRGAEIISDTTPAATQKVIDTTTADNAKITQSNTDATAKATAATAAKQPIRDAATAGTQALADEPKIREDLSALKGKVKSRVNTQYGALNSKLGPSPIPAGVFDGAIDEAAGMLRGPEHVTPLMNDITERMAGKGASLTYSDLQGYRQKLGSELQRGTLDPGVYRAYQTLQNSIDDAMHEVASGQGMGDDFTRAKADYAQYMDTFHKPGSAVRNAIRAVDTGKTLRAFHGKDVSGVGAVAKYDPELATRIDSATKAHVGAPTANQVAGAAPVTPELQPITQLGPAEIQTAKEGNIAQRAADIRKRGQQAAATVSGLDMLSSAVQGHFSFLRDLGIGGATLAGSEAIARTLSNPRVIDFLSKPTAADLDLLSQLPPEARTELGNKLAPAVRMAKARGARIAPAIAAIVSGGSHLPPSHPLAAPPTAAPAQ